MLSNRLISRVQAGHHVVSTQYLLAFCRSPKPCLPGVRSGISLLVGAVAEDWAMSNSYLDALLWLTPSNPYPVNQAGQTVITYAFGHRDTYAVHDPESTVDLVDATAWHQNEQQAATQAFQAWAAVANIALSPDSSFSSAALHLLTTTEAGMEAYFSGSKDIQAMST